MKVHGKADKLFSVMRVSSLSFALAVLIGHGAMLAAASSRKPNVVILLADDLGWADVSYHDKRAATPRIDRLAAEGIQLDRFYTAPMCSPTRAGLMTGRYPIRFGLARAVIPAYRDYGLSPEERTLAEALADVGYENRAVFGKWHLGHLRAEWHPLNQGFSHFHGHYNGAIDYFTLERNGERDWHVDWEPSDEKGYSTDLIAGAAAFWIRQQAKRDAPYFCYVAFNAPHEPFQAKPADLARFPYVGGDPSKVGEKPGRGELDRATIRRALISMIWSMDQGVGRILDAIDASGEAENTMVWFFSDNGGIDKLPDNNAPLRGNKLDVFEGGVRVPACVRWPAGWSGGRRLSQAMNCIDVMPTVLAAAGEKPEGSPNRPLDGIDLGPVLRGEIDALEDRELYFYQGQSGPDSEKIAVSTPQWKLVVLGPQLSETGTTDRHEVYLFRLPEDLLERTNVADRHPRVVERLLVKLIAFRSLQPADAVPPIDEGRRGFKPPEKWRLSPKP